MVLILLGITVLLLFGIAAVSFLWLAVRPSERRLLLLRFGFGVFGIALLAWIMAVSNWMVFEGVTDIAGGRAQTDGIEAGHYFLSGFGDKGTPVTRETFERLQRYHDISVRLLAITTPIFAAVWLTFLLVCRIQLRRRSDAPLALKAVAGAVRGAERHQEDGNGGPTPALPYRVALQDDRVAIEVSGGVLTVRVSPERSGHWPRVGMTGSISIIGIAGILTVVIFRGVFVRQLIGAIFLSGTGWLLSLAAGILLFAAVFREIRRTERPSVLSIGPDRVYVDSSMRILGPIDVARGNFHGVTMKSLSLWPGNSRLLLSAVFESRAPVPFVST